MCQKCQWLKSYFIANCFHDTFPPHCYDLTLSRYYINKFTVKNKIKHDINEINIFINDWSKQSLAIILKMYNFMITKNAIIFLGIYLNVNKNFI